MKRFIHLSIVRGIGYSLVLIFCLSCQKDLDSTNPSQLSSESISDLATPSILSQTRTANIFNGFRGSVLLLWAQGDHQSVSADDGSYAVSKKLSAGRGTLQLQLPDFRFDIPSGATIENITVDARRFKTGKGSIRDHVAYLIKKDPLNPGFTFNGVVWSNPDYYPSVESTVSYSQNGSGNNGGLGNLVYEWTPDMINALEFGVRIYTYDLQGSPVTVYYDMVSITVQYSLPEVIPQ